MKNDVIIQQLMALRAQVDAMLMMLTDGAIACTHPSDQRLNLTTMGGPEKWECRACGYTYEEGVSNGHSGTST